MQKITLARLFLPPQVTEFCKPSLIFSFRSSHYFCNPAVNEPKQSKRKKENRVGLSILGNYSKYTAVFAQTSHVDPLLLYAALMTDYLNLAVNQNELN